MSGVIVIGAGPAGIVATKELIEQGATEVVCLERTNAIGGVFTGSYDSLELTSSVTFSMFSDFWVGDGKSNDFWTKEEAVAYWRAYANHFGVLPRIRFGSTVERIERAASEWDVYLEGGEVLRASRLVLAVGNNRSARRPAFCASLTQIESVHSAQYKHASPFVGKRVLIVGGGESAADIALEISRVASRCWISLRESTGWIVPRRRGAIAADVATHRGVWGLPRDFGPSLTRRILELEESRKDPVYDAVVDLNRRIRNPLGIWGTYGTKSLALPVAIANHGCTVVGAITAVHDGGRRLTAADGLELADVDAVIFCTGFVNRIDFLPEDLRAPDPRSMYKHVFHPELGDRAAWIGWARPAFGSQFPVMELQARLVARVYTGKHRLPPAATLARVAADDAEANIAQFEDNARRIRSLVDYHHYMDDLASLLGCSPPLARYLLRHPRIWLRLVYGPTQATQFRLRGPGKKVELAHEILRKLPVSRFDNHVVRAGLRGRLRYFLRRSTSSR